MATAGSGRADGGGRWACPSCGGEVHPVAGRCKHCRVDLRATPAVALAVAVADEAPPRTATAPADGGLATLGLLMQLAGALLGGYAVLLGGPAILGAPFVGRSWWLVLLLAACLARAAAHVAAGRTLLYGRRRGEFADEAPAVRPLAGITRYLWLAGAQTAVVTAIALAVYDLSARTVLAIDVGLLLWPAMLGGLISRPRFARFRDGLPLAEDKGFEGAAVLMLGFGAAGTLAVAVMLLHLLRLPTAVLQQGAIALVVLVLLSLGVRAGLHVHAGVVGLGRPAIERAAAAVRRYTTYSVIDGLCIAAAMALILLLSRLDPLLTVRLGALTWMLLAWPLALRRFFGDRELADLIAGPAATGHRPTPDGGQTSLGWLLVGHAAVTLALMLPALIGGDALATALGVLATADERPWHLALAALELGAGLALLELDPRARLVATAYGVVGAAGGIILSWPVLAHFANRTGGWLTERGVVTLTTLTLTVVLPLVALVMVRRRAATAS
jgi:hypothetical protein